MTNQEIIDRQRAAREHQERLPEAIEEAKLSVSGPAKPDDHRAPHDNLTAGHVRTLLREIERLQAGMKLLQEDLKESERSHGDTYSQGRSDQREESDRDRF